MFDITGEDIARLNDADLRTLVALLCEAELGARALPTACVTWGGHQAAPDGGIDVRVALPPNTAIDGFVPRPASGFQVKKQDMPRSEVLDEMRPHGVLRASIRELAEQDGAYVIVSADGSTADSALTDRRSAMTEAIADLPTSAVLGLDFYDRTRLASWVRNHAGLVTWVREKSGRPLREWRAFGAWAYPQEGMIPDYLLDEQLRIKTGKHGEEAGLGALAGIEQIRDHLRQPRAVVRLVGVSGVGKTRLVQVLFDERIGTCGLDPALAIYTNVADGPDPQPVGMVSDLIALRMRAIVVVDNCPPELHRRLTDVARSPESMVSVITIEYDVRDDRPEDTDVYALEPSSEALITKLLERRFPGLSQVDAGTIAEFSGGNARIAVALAASVGRGESLAGLSDDVLFRRLFEQRNDSSPALYLAAQACSIVYSFNGDSTRTDGDAELFRLGLLVGQAPEELFGHTAELRRRDLMQARGPWRAVLPHAIASRLATAALQNIPPTTIQTFLRGAPLRLLRSFSRRLGYLDSVEAQRIVKEWLSIDGLLADPAALNEDGRAMLQNVAPVSPQETLSALERAFGNPETSALESAKQYLDLLRSLAYDPALFVRCANLLANSCASKATT